ncbi:hypothetical protein P8X24_08025 [Pyrococcus kukulkanii]|uniref:hypothetical protein n=1 Tax=Pyrococcus kukulkanii TaxID=1609559 RepID=UPI003566B9DA
MTLAKEFLKDEKLLRALAEEIKKHAGRMEVYVDLPDDPELIKEMKADTENFEYVEEENIMRVKFQDEIIDWGNEREWRDAVWALLHVLDYYNIDVIYVGEGLEAIELRDLYLKRLRGEISVFEGQDHTEGEGEVVRVVSEDEELEVEVEAFISSLKKLINLASGGEGDE